MDAKLGQSLVDIVKAINSKTDNTFSNISVNGTTIQADSKADTLTLVAGDNINLTADTTNDKITISATGGGGSSGSTRSYSSYPIKSYNAVTSGSTTNYSTWTPSAYGYYDITIWGASGCVSNNASTYNAVAGRGAALSGRFLLTPDDTVLFIVGQVGILTGTPSSGATDLTSGAGGGCTIVAKAGSNSNTNLNFTYNGTNYQLLMLAAGGGGTSDCTYKKTNSKSGGDGRATNSYLATPSNLLTKGINLSSLAAVTYTRNGVTATGGYPCGQAVDDTSAKGGAWGWSSSEPYIGTSFINNELGELIGASDGVNDGYGRAQIAIALDPFTQNLDDPDLVEATFGTLSNIIGKSVKNNISPTTLTMTDSLVTEKTVYYGLPSINASHSYNSISTYYAPTSVGTNGYILKSTGSGAPSWLDPSTIAKITKSISAVGTGDSNSNVNNYCTVLLPSSATVTTKLLICFGSVSKTKKTTAVNFATSFSSIPTVITTAISYGDYQAHRVNPTAITTSSFTMGYNSGQACYYIAIGTVS